MKEKVIYCAPILGYPAIGGPELKAQNVLISLSNIYEVKLILWKPIENPEFKRFLEQRKIELFRVERSEFNNLEIQSKLLSGKFLTAWRLLRHKLAFEVARDRRVVAQSIISIAKHVDTDIVWFSYSNYYTEQFLMLRKYGQNLKLVADTDSVSSRYTLRGIPYVAFRKKMKLLKTGIREIYNEVQLVKKSNILTAVSEVDLKHYSSLGRSADIELAYNVVNVPDYNLVKVNSPERFVLITGSFGHYDSPMDHGTRWFIENVWPLLKREVPDVRLRIVGKNSDIIWGNLDADDIDVLGWVPDTRTHIASAMACVVPLWFESGTRYKILEAGVLKTPVVTTTLGAEGLDLQDEKDLYIADEPEFFALRLSQVLLGTSATKMSESLYNKVVDKYSISNLDTQVKSIVNKLM